jgi:hypothetical protein
MLQDSTAQHVPGASDSFFQGCDAGLSELQCFFFTMGVFVVLLEEH